MHRKNTSRQQIFSLKHEVFAWQTPNGIQRDAKGIPRPFRSSSDGQLPVPSVLSRILRHAYDPTLYNLFNFYDTHCPPLDDGKRIPIYSYYSGFYPICQYTYTLFIRKPTEKIFSSFFIVLKF